MAAFKREKKQAKLTPNDEPKERHLEVMEFRASGNHFHQDDLMKLAIPNEREPKLEGFDRVFKYNFKNKPVSLYEDLDAPDGLNGVKVLVDGIWVGVVPADKSQAVREILNHGEVKYISCRITGGPCTLYGNGTVMNEEDRMIAVSVRIGYVVEG